MANNDTYEILKKQNEMLNKEIERQEQIIANATRSSLLTSYYKFLIFTIPFLLLLPYINQLDLLKMAFSDGKELCQISIEQAEDLLIRRGFVITDLLYKPYQIIVDFSYIALAIALIGFFGYKFMQSRSDRNLDILKIKHVNSTVDKIKIVVFTLILVLITIFIVQDAKKQVAYYESMVKVMKKVATERYQSDEIKYFLSDPKLRESCFSSSNIQISLPTKETYNSSKNQTSLDLSTQ